MCACRQVFRIACGLLWPALTFGAITETTLTIGHEYSVVREVRRVTVSAGEQDLVLEDIPAEADLSSLTIRMRRVPVQLLEWERISDRPQPQLSTGPRITLEGPVSQDPAGINPAQVGGVRCRVIMPLSGERTIEVSYLLKGLEWTAAYEVYLRGEAQRGEERVSLDLVGQVRIRNQTGRAFTNTLIRLVGSDPRGITPAEHRRGFLMLADIPFADLWRSEDDARLPEQVYRLPRRFDLPAYAQTEAPFIRGERIGGSRLFVMDAAAIPLSVTDTLRPLTAFLVFVNTSANQLGWTLPPGPVRVYRGAVRQSAIATGFLPHTAVGQQIRVDLGPSAEVQGARRSLSRIQTEPGRFEERYRLTVRNGFPRAVAVEILERPPERVNWRVERSSMEYEVDRGRLRMQPTLRGGETLQIELRLGFQDPN